MASFEVSKKEKRFDRNIESLQSCSKFIVNYVLSKWRKGNILSSYMQHANSSTNGVKEESTNL